MEDAMTVNRTESDTLTAARALADIAAQVSQSAVESAARLTDGGKAIDEHQVHAERIAQLATEARAAGELGAYPAAQAATGMSDPLASDPPLVFPVDAP